VGIVYRTGARVWKTTHFPPPRFAVFFRFGLIATSRFRIFGSFLGFLVWHSQITATRHPKVLNSDFTRASRLTLEENFLAQYFEEGAVAFRQPGCRCQKHPCTKSANFRFGKIISGLPGKSRRWILKRKPRACAAFLTRISGDVFFPRTLDISHDRRAGDSRSIISTPPRQASASQYRSLTQLRKVLRGK
jgi:hypothetical protein